MRALGIALVALCAVSAYAAEVVVFGDSWGAFGGAGGIAAGVWSVVR